MATEVVGEITGYKLAPSGHHYFSLKDTGATLTCVLLSYQARWIKCELRDGAKVVVKAKADFYAPMGRFSLMIESVKAAGEGQPDDRRARQHADAKRRGGEQECEGKPAHNAQEEPRHAGIIAACP